MHAFMLPFGLEVYKSLGVSFFPFLQAKAHFASLEEAPIYTFPSSASGQLCSLSVDLSDVTEYFPF